ncbi:MAG TPA: tetratricopeptide repeat protein [Thermoanaerobaculia bacterium]|jgi:tetratricopeptide (TPR) repeat protein
MTKAARLFAALLLACAATLHAHEGLHEQIAAMTKRIAAEPRNASLYLQRGELHRLHHEWKLAEADYEKAARLDASLDLVHFARGRMLLESGHAAAALRSLDRFLAAHPEHSDAHLTRARALAQLGRDAAADYDAAIAHAAHPSPDLYAERARTLASRGRTDDALRGLDQALASLGPIASLQLQAIDLELQAKRYDAALARLDTLTPPSPLHLARRGDILLQAGRTAEAQAVYRNALVAIAAMPERQRNMQSTKEVVARLEAAVGKQ